MVDRAIEGLECDKVMFDHEMGGYMATRYLIEQGHCRIACLVNARRSNTGRKRLAGYERALREAGLPIDALLEFESDSECLRGLGGGACDRCHRRVRKLG